MNKKILAGITCTSLIAGMGVASAGAFTPETYSTDLTVYLNGENVYANSDNQPCIMNDRTMVQIRPIFEKLGYTVDYNDENKTAIFYSNYNNVPISFTNGSYEAHTLSSEDGSIVDTYKFDVPATIYNDVFYVPIRGFCEVANLNIEWDDASRSVYIGSKVENKTENKTLTFEEAQAKAEEYVNNSDISCVGDNTLVTYNGKQAYVFKLYSKSLVANGGTGFLGEIVYVYIDDSGVEKSLSNGNDISGTANGGIVEGEYRAYSDDAQKDGIANLTITSVDDEKMHIEYKRRNSPESYFAGDLYLKDDGTYYIAGEDYGVTLEYRVTPIDSENVILTIIRTENGNKTTEDFEFIKQ